ALAERPRVAAVITVDLYGQCCDYDAIASVCSPRTIPVIQDAAEALGSTYRGAPAGAQGDLAVFSFNGNKIVTSSGGGALLAHNEEWLDQARKLATQAREPVVHYEHSELGFNYRLSNLLAAVGRAQLATLDRRVLARRAINARYRAALGDLPGWSFMPEAGFGRSTCWLTCATTGSRAVRDAVLDRLAAEDIEARPLWK